MNRKNPIKFLDSYTTEDKDIFFGREKDTAKLYEKVSQSKVVLLYGLSGTGKTSLINCGLENCYEPGDRIFIYVRRGSNILHSIRQEISLEANSLIHPHASPVDAIETLYYDYLKPVTIIFDQFEELFISGSFDEIQEFIDAVAEILLSGLKVKIIFSMREEYLAHLDEFEEKIPLIYDHRYRLEKMRRSTLEDVITKMTEQSNYSLESENIPGQIIDNISDRKGNVELPYLQVYLDKLTRLAKKSKKDNRFTNMLVSEAGELQDVLGDFLDEQVDEIARKKIDKDYVNAVLKQMITPDGTKRQLVFTEFKVIGDRSQEELLEVLSELENSRIVKLDDGVYELSHDSLAQKVAEKRTAEEIQLIEVIKFIRNAYLSYRQTATVLDLKQLKFVQPFLPKLDLSDEEKKLLKVSQRKVRNRKIVMWIFGFATLIVLLGLGFLWQYNKYQSLKKEADAQMERAEYRDARTNYLRAIDTYIPNKKAAIEGLARTDSLLTLEPEFNKLINEGNGFFSLGINYYDLSFTRYNAAKNLNYNNVEADNVIDEKTTDAIGKYTELAKIENEEGHTDIAMAHLAKAFVLDRNDTIVIGRFENIVIEKSKNELSKASENISSNNEDVIPDLLDLLKMAGQKEMNQEKYNLIKSTINK